MGNPVHHIELWTDDLATIQPAFDWLLPRLGWAADHDPQWPEGKVWRHESGAYVVLEQSPAVTGPHDRMRAGLNHLALRIDSRELLDEIRAEAGEHGWSELFAEDYPHAGGPDYTALYLENAQGFEIEIVVTDLHLRHHTQDLGASSADLVHANRLASDLEDASR